MEFNKLVFAGLSVGCLAAAAGGSYLAVRQNQSASALVQSSEPRDSGAPEQKAPSAVTESEGVIAPEPAETGGRASSAAGARAARAGNRRLAHDVFAGRTRR